MERPDTAPMFRSALQAFDAQSGSSQALRSARRGLLLLSGLAMAGTLLAAAVGLVAANWTYRALQDATVAAEAVRLHGQVDMMHDAIRGDVAEIGSSSQEVRADLVRHLAVLEESLAALTTLELPPSLAAGMRAEAEVVRKFAGRAQRILYSSTPVSGAELENFTGHWRSLEAPLGATSERLFKLVEQARESGRHSHGNGLMFMALSLLAILAGLLFATRRISNAVLATSRQLAAATKAARQAERSRSDFLAAMSHEIRTPMTGVLGMVDLLAAADLAPHQRKYVESLRASGRHLLNVINDILDFTRIESGKLELEEIDFSLPDVLERLRSLVHPLAADRHLALEIQLAPHSPPALRGDPTRIQQVLLNLVSNGIKFTERGSVTLAVAPVGDAAVAQRYRFEVRDTGVGIPPERQAELFSAFRQADETIARRYGGSGLGLAISKRLVEAMGGSIGVQSVSGLGSVFFFELPLAPGDPRRLVAQETARAAAMVPRRILVAEDVEINREILQATLRRAGHTVVFAHDGMQALQLLQQQDFDLVLMDVQMPVMDGIEATRRIRRLPPPRGELPILALTANVMAQEREGYLAAGMDECLTKPIDWNQMFAAIARHTPGGAGPAGPAPPAPADPGAEAPLLDASTLARLQEMSGRVQLREWLQGALQGYERCSQAMAGAADAAGVAAEAHKIRGSGSTLGLARIGALAARIEAAAQGGTVPRALIVELNEALAATKEELREMDLL